MERFNSRRAGWGGAWSNGHARNKSVRGGPRRRLGPSAPHQRFFLSFYFFSFILCEDASQDWRDFKSLWENQSEIGDGTFVVVDEFVKKRGCFKSFKTGIEYNISKVLNTGS